MLCICPVYAPYVQLKALYNILYLLNILNSRKKKFVYALTYICTNLLGSEAEQGHKVKLKVLTPLNFVTSPSFSVTSPSCKPT